MAFLRSPLSNDPGPVVRGDGLFLRPPQNGDYAAWAELRAKSRAHLTPWEPTWAPDELSRASYRRRLRLYAQEMRDDLGYAFFIFTEPDERLLGGVTLSNVRRGVTQAVTLGYWTGAPFAGQGCMSRAVAAILPFVFDDLRLHRVEAACLPQNIASQRVLQRNGFQREGLARRYLRIDGAWRDHELFAVVLEDFVGGGGPA
jgi:ribosomal-protein-alanine N-acetyltransferase